MSDLQDSWKELASKAESLGLKLKLHLEQESAPEQADIEATDGSGTSGSRDPKVLAEEAARKVQEAFDTLGTACLLYTSPSPRDRTRSRMPSSA